MLLKLSTTAEWYSEKDSALESIGFIFIPRDFGDGTPPRGFCIIAPLYPVEINSIDQLTMLYDAGGRFMVDKNDDTGLLNIKFYNDFAE